jgi:small subunit ribosomal protein S16
MAVKIRLSRIGKKHVPFYRIVAVDSRSKRDGAFLEDLGTYDTLKSNVVTINGDRIDYWLSVGAIPTDSFTKVHKQYKRAMKVSQEKVIPVPKAAKKTTTNKKVAPKAQ